jgi:hypothetical protein
MRCNRGAHDLGDLIRLLNFAAWLSLFDLVHKHIISLCATACCVGGLCVLCLRSFWLKARCCQSRGARLRLHTSD